MHRSTSSWVLALSLAVVVGCGGAGGPTDPDAAAILDAGDAAHADVGTDARVGDGATPDAGTDASAGDAAVDAWAEDVGADDAATVDAWVDLPDVSLPDSGIAACSPGYTLCGATCRDLSADSEACGSCDRGCIGDHVLGATCAASRCDVTACNPGYADLDGTAIDGCEAAQDFSIALDEPSIVVGAGGTASIGVTITRINGFPLGLSISVLDAPLSLGFSPVSLSVATHEIVTVTASPFATPGTYAARVVVSTSLLGTTFLHELPITLRIVSTPVSITSVEILRGTVAMPGNEVPQGAGSMRLRVHGAGLSSVGNASIPGVSLSDVLGATDTLREWDFVIPHGRFVNDAGRAPLALTLTAIGGAPLATFAGALVLTHVVVATTGNDVTGLGTFASPVRTMLGGYLLAGAGDSIALASGTYVSESVEAPAGLAEIHGMSATTVSCVGGSTDGLTLATAGRVRALTISGCTTAVRVNDGSGGPTILDGITVDAGRPLSVSLPNHVSVLGSTLMGLPLELGGGSADVRYSTLRGLVAVSTVVNVFGCHFDAPTGDAITIGPSSAPSTITNSVARAVGGTCLRVGAGASLVIDGMTVGESPRGLVVDGATVDADSLYVQDTSDVGIVLTGASPSISLHGTIRSEIFDNALGMRVAAASGTATVTLGAANFERNTAGGIDVQNAAGVTTHIVAPHLWLTGNAPFGIRVDGGTTNIDAGSVVDASSASASAAVLDLVSGAGTIEISNGTWTLPVGTGIDLQGGSRHTVRLGTSARTLVMDMTGHVFDGFFGIHDDRGAPTPLGATLARVQFIGSDGAARTWHGTFTSTGSYAAGLTPRDLASWLVAHSSSLDFGAP